MLAIAVVAMGACSVTTTDNNNGNGNSSFSGDVPTGPSCSSSCDSCAKTKCGTQAACLHDDCEDFLNCFCQCAAGDMDCQFPCNAFKTPDNHCLDCDPGANACLRQNCASECPDFNPDLSSGTIDSGTGDDGGGTGNDGGGVTIGTGPFPWIGPSCPANCGQCVADSCATAASCLQTACGSFYQCLCGCDPSDIVCVSSCPPPSSACETCANTANTCIQQNCSTCAGAMGGGGTGTNPDDSCATLTGCCQTLASSADQESCASTVLDQVQTECASKLAMLQGEGMCL
jgi:hypothetical protein